MEEVVRASSGLNSGLLGFDVLLAALSNSALATCNTFHDRVQLPSLQAPCAGTSYHVEQQSSRMALHTHAVICSDVLFGIKIILDQYICSKSRQKSYKNPQAL